MKKIHATLPDWLEGYHTEYPKVQELTTTPYSVENSLWLLCHLRARRLSGVCTSPFTLLAGG